MLILDEIIESLKLFRLDNPEDFDRRSKCPFFDNTLKLGECWYCKLLFPDMNLKKLYEALQATGTLSILHAGNSSP